jgi:hypothetical protein
MTFQEKLQQLKQEMFNLISTKDITFLYNFDNRIDVNKLGKFNYHILTELHTGDIWRFLHKLEDDRIYAVIPMLSKNITPEEPFIVLSPTILVTNNSNSCLIAKHMISKIDKTNDLYDIDIDDNNYNITLKYKEVNFDYHEYKTF